MRAIMLAAGIGKRLFGGKDTALPKVLLEFEGTSLLERHLTILKYLGVEDLTLVVGYRQELLRQAVARLGAENFVRFVENPDFLKGPILSLWLARTVLDGASDVLFMDADVLYPASMMKRLAARPGTVFLMDRDFVPGDEPVKLCLKDGAIVEFGKTLPPGLAFDAVGEWPGFAKFGPAESIKMVEALRPYIERGALELPYEPAMRDMMLADPAVFAIEDVSGLPWIEIDFPEDLERARTTILPKIRAQDGG
ncbi:MAG: phosphocholine cytidylyltransferase family protein [Alphaproteobacteria bacterium]|nr:phosphocholine cytidylyltransferase family protein [Alphaproteobacteria bacterium]